MCRTPCRQPPPSPPPLQSLPPLAKVRNRSRFNDLANHLGAGGEGGHQLALLVKDEGGGDGGVGGRVEHPEGARDLPSLVLHQGDAQLLQGGASKLPKIDRKRTTLTMLAKPVSLNRVCGDGNKATVVTLERGGKSAEEAGRHWQEVALNINIE